VLKEPKVHKELKEEVLVHKVIRVHKAHKVL
jgi:hypothetical protein